MKRTTTGALAAVLGIFAAACGDDMDMDDDMPAAPSELHAEPLSDGAHLTWKDNSSDEASFMIERMAGSEAFTTLASVPFDTIQYHDAGLTAGTTYKYRVMAMPKAGSHGTKYSNEVTFVAP